MSQAYYDADGLLEQEGRDANGVLTAIEEAEYNWLEMVHKRGEPGFDELPGLGGQPHHRNDECRGRDRHHGLHRATYSFGIRFRK